MDWRLTILELIDLRSFSNLWYWIGLAVVWSSASHWVLGVPFDMVGRARIRGGQALDDLETLVRIHAGRIRFIAEEGGAWLTGIASFGYTALLVLGFYYRVEFAQAVFLLLFPMGLVSLMNLRAARRIAAGWDSPDELIRLLGGLRLRIQALGLVSIVVTAMWGMYQNLAHTVTLSI